MVKLEQTAAALVLVVRLAFQLVMVLMVVYQTVVLLVTMRAAEAEAQAAQAAMLVLLAQLKEVKGASVFLSQAQRSEVAEVEEDALH
jgi:hypothetical protein